MKLLFFSDVHGSPESLELLERHIDSRSPDLLVLLGDALYHGPRNPLRPDYAPPQVVEQLNRRKEQIVAVRGNCDSEVDQMLLEFPLMSDYSTLLVDGHRFFLTHGHLWNPGQLPPIPAGAVFTYGHTHLPQLERLENGRIAFNPGSISLPKGGNPASFGFYEDGVLTVCRLQDAGEMLRLSLEP
ncbi:phosphodiesterase [Victivallis vadensis]|uniref:phosphodiesterase n=1 Tax=Victivallis vadensis TaxID=172901 RepID=UPI0023F4A557|nr:phosphodiesterase [Victivallis vadensis]